MDSESPYKWCQASGGGGSDNGDATHPEHGPAGGAKPAETSGSEDGGISASRQYVAPWYLAYLILGLVNSGLLPFLLPLTMAGLVHDLSSIAYVIAAYNAGMLPAPLLGALAERRRQFRPVFFGGFVVLAVALAWWPASSSLASWVIWALLAGLGVGAVATVAPLFVVDFAPKDEWEPRIGWLQSFNGAGQLAGLLIAGGIAAYPLSYGFWASSAFALVAVVIGHVGLPADGHRRRWRSPRVAWQKAMGHVQPAPAIGGLLQHSHHLQSAALHRLPEAFAGKFGLFLLAWVLANAGIAPFFAYYPLLMSEKYGVSPTATAFLYAAAAGLGIGLFAYSGRVAKKIGPRPVFRFGLAVRILGFGMLACLDIAPLPDGRFVAMIAFAVTMLAWPVLSVSSTGLAARLTSIGEGAAMGLLAASGAIATLVGTFLGGPLVEASGYGVVPVVALIGLMGAELLMRGAGKAKAP